MNQNPLVIGIDPDASKSGVAVFGRNTRKLTLHNLHFFDLFENLKGLKGEIEKVYLEAGWLNKSNWHARNGDAAKFAAETGRRTGANHETGRKIAEMLDYLGIPYELVKPERTKLDAKMFKRIFGYEGRTNQETRDAAGLLAKYL